jgi:hypothetical protein
MTTAAVPPEGVDGDSSEEDRRANAEADEATDTSTEDREDTPRIAVVIVHGMGEQRPVETLNGFVCTALKPTTHGTWDYYYSRPAEVTKSYEARRYIAPARPDLDLDQAQTELFEYHWSYLMTGNKIGDLFGSTTRLLVRRAKHVPPGLRGIWKVAWWAVVLAFLMLAAGCVASFFVPPCVRAVAGSAVVVGAVTLIIGAVRNKITNTFVDVVRYLDTSPRSYAARRAIRGGLVDLLRGLHDQKRYTRIVVVAHSLGAFISYDAMSSLWADLHEFHAGPPGPAEPGKQIRLEGLTDLQKAADDVLECARTNPCLSSDLPTGDPVQKAHLDEWKKVHTKFQDCQYALGKGLRKQGNPWRITDFVSVGTPMYLADILCTNPGLLSGWRKPAAARTAFGDMMRRGELVRCPPRSETQTVEDPVELTSMKYRWRYGTRQVLGSQSLFAVVRWTNLWFPVETGSVRGDFFGGPLQTLFGPGIREKRVMGNTPGREARWGVAHGRYFDYPDDDGETDIAHYIRQILDLGDTVDIAGTLPTDPNTGGDRIAAD